MTMIDVEASDVHRVFYVAKTHLDVGFTDSAAAVRRRYLDEFFPRAMRVAAELRARDERPRLRWTTGSWILTEALEAASGDDRRTIEAAVEAGDLCWHALPFTMHTELCDVSLLEHGLSLSAALDRRFGRTTRSAKVTDVPGHTRGLVPVLAAAGVDFLHVGVNPAAAAPAVPEQFRWLDRNGGDPAAIHVMYQHAGYGDVQVLAGAPDTAVFVDLTGDNLGPRSAEDVVAAFGALERRFPGAEVRAATLDDVADVLRRSADVLPTVTEEIGDAWIQGVATDPPKLAAFRALRDQRRSWIEDGEVDRDEPAFAAASTSLLLVAEHTWGLDQKTHWPDEDHWSATDLAAVRDRPDTVAFEGSWAEQRAYLDGYLDALAATRPDLAEQARAAQTPPAAPELRDEQQVRPGAPVVLGGFEVTVDPIDGSIVGVVDVDGREWAGPEHPLARLRHRTYDAVDFERWFETFNASTLPDDEWWARWDNTKPGLDGSGAASRWWPTEFVDAQLGEGDRGSVLRVDLRFDVGEDDPVTVVPEATYWIAEVDGALQCTLRWSSVAARWPSSTWWSFGPRVGAPVGWTMSKLGRWVDPLDVVDRGGRRLHVVDRLRHRDGIDLALLDAPLVAVGSADLLRWDDEPLDLDGGWHVCAHDNVWGTNFPMWFEGDAVVRVTLEFESAQGAGGSSTGGSSTGGAK